MDAYDLILDIGQRCLSPYTVEDMIRTAYKAQLITQDEAESLCGIFGYSYEQCEV